MNRILQCFYDLGVHSWCYWDDMMMMIFYRGCMPITFLNATKKNISSSSIIYEPLHPTYGGTGCGVWPGSIGGVRTLKLHPTLTWPSASLLLGVVLIKLKRR